MLFGFQRQYLRSLTLLARGKGIEVLSVMSAVAVRGPSEDGTSSQVQQGDDEATSHPVRLTDLDPDLIAGISTFLDVLANADMMNLCAVLGRERSRELRLAYLRNNFNYLRCLLFKMISKINAHRRWEEGNRTSNLIHDEVGLEEKWREASDYRAICRERILSWMAINTDWRQRCTAEKMEMYQNPFVVYETTWENAFRLVPLLTRDKYKRVLGDDDFPFVWNPLSRSSTTNVINCREDLPHLDEFQNEVTSSDCLVEISEGSERAHDRHSTVDLTWAETFRLLSDLHDGRLTWVDEDGDVTDEDIVFKFIHHPDLIFNNPSVATELGLTEILQHHVEVHNVNLNTSQWRGLAHYEGRNMPLALVALVYSPGTAPLEYLFSAQDVDLGFELEG